MYRTDATAYVHLAFVDGGAIAHGHPIGATGAILIT